MNNGVSTIIGWAALTAAVLGGMLFAFYLCSWWWCIFLLRVCLCVRVECVIRSVTDYTISK